MNLQTRIDKLLREKGKLKRWHKVVSALACVVVFCTTYVLIMPALTMERDTYCGFTEHTHADSCYTQVLVCGLEENEAHKHSEECYEQQLTCGMDEHTHVLACYSNPHADVEDAADWEASMDDLELTDDLRANVAAVAESQVGYKESTENYVVMEDGESIKGYTRYGAWYDQPYEDWDGMFIAFCLYYAGVSEDDMPMAYDCIEWTNVLADHDLYVSPEGYDVQPGDLVFIDDDPEDDHEGPDRVALVSEVKYDKEDALVSIKTVEGNPAENKVTRVTYEADDAQLAAYGVLNVIDPDEDETEGLTETAVETEKETETETEARADAGVIGTLSAKGEDYEVQVEYTAEAGFPEDVELWVSEIEAEDELDSYIEQSEDLLDVDLSEKQNEARFFDITFKDGNGDEIKPEAGVKVTINVTPARTQSNISDVQVVHFGDEAETVDCTTENSDDLNVEFEADHFSVYGVVYSVDFSYEVDGQVYEYSLPGGGYVPFSKLVKVLGIADDDAQAFIEGVENVEFSNPEVVWVGKSEENTTVGELKEANELESAYSNELTQEQIDEINAQEVPEGEWALISLQPFESEESLTVTMKNGEQFGVKVTDAQGTAVSGTTSLEAGDYMIVYQDGDKYYALTNGGGKVEVNYNTKTNTATYNGPENITWTVSYDYYDSRDYYYNFLAKDQKSADGNHRLFIGLSDSSIVVNDHGACAIKPSNEPGKYVMYTSDHSLSWDKGNFKTGKNYEAAPFYLVKLGEVPVQYNFTVTVDNSTYGSVSGTNIEGQATGEVASYQAMTGVVDNNGIGWYDCSKHNITAIPKDGYVFDYWEADGTWLTAEPVLDGSNGRNLGLASDNAVVTAHFKPNTTISEDLTEKEIEDRLTSWVSDMITDTVNTSKTAQVSDYGNRIYEITMGASSGVRRVMPRLDIAFITDVSRSMYFPATLKPVEGGTFTQGTTNSKGDWSDTSLYDWLQNKADKNQVYYVVVDAADDPSATVTAIYYAGRGKNKYERAGAAGWQYIDSSFLNPPDADKLTGNEAEALKGKDINMYGRNDSTGHLLDGQVYTATGNLKRMDYLKMAAESASNVVYGVDPKSRIGLVTFAADTYKTNSNGGYLPAAFYNNPGTGDNAFYAALEGVNLHGGTDQADGLDAGTDLFKEKSKSEDPLQKRVAILITDGAPNQSDRTNWNTVIAPAATSLKDVHGKNSVTLYTLGLSMDMVGKTNREGLQSIATGGVNGGHWFEASNGPGIVAAIKSIIESVINEAALKGDITDSIDQAFYPVSKDGDPLSAGDMIDLEGNKIDAPPADGKYGVITKDGDIFGVKWSNQVVGYSNNGSTTWTGKFYIKAKEDFLGGNTINTNAGKGDKFTPTKYVIDNKEYDLHEGDDKKLEKTFETPHVNVDELTLTQNNTVWTVYLGTEVDPMEQIEALLDNIKVKEVVSSSDNYMITDKAKMLGSSKTDASETFLLRHAVNLENLSDAEKQSLLKGEMLTKPYSAYGHNNVGKMVLTLIKAGDSADFNKHNTSETGNAVERYIVSTVYQPNDVDTDKAYLTTADGSPGNEAERMISSNVHIINVYAKKLSVRKVDQLDKLIDTLPATFTLYRKAAAGDKASDYVPSASIPDSLPKGQNYILVEEAATADGVAQFENQLNRSYEYYLVETKAPEGYIRPNGYYHVSIDTKDLYTKTIDNTDPLTSEQKWPVTDPITLSNWEQSSKVLVSGSDSEASANVIYGESGDGTGYNYDSTADTRVIYRIRNDSGVELPSAGGIGTKVFTLPGICLMAFAAAMLGYKKKRTASGNCSGRRGGDSL